MKLWIELVPVRRKNYNKQPPQGRAGQLLIFFSVETCRQLGTCVGLENAGRHVSFLQRFRLGIFCWAKRSSKKHTHEKRDEVWIHHILQRSIHMILVFSEQFFLRDWVHRVANLRDWVHRVANLGGSKVTTGSNLLDDGLGISSSSTTFLGRPFTHPSTGKIHMHRRFTIWHTVIKFTISSCTQTKIHKQNFVSWFSGDLPRQLQQGHLHRQFPSDAFTEFLGVGCDSREGIMLEIPIDIHRGV